jgi:serine/threonine protein kinase
VKILRQCLSALVYLHGHEKPIVHRDIKPENILVQSRDAGNIHVKLADFGLTRESCDLTTICGTWRYLAPEVHEENDRRKAGHSKKKSYTPAVDIWSLGVVVFECAYDLPCGNAAGVLWCREIAERLRKDLKKKPDDLKQFLWATMVIMEPKSRGSAEDC